MEYHPPLHLSIVVIEKVANFTYMCVCVVAKVIFYKASFYISFQDYVVIWSQSGKYITLCYVFHVLRNQVGGAWRLEIV